MTPSQYIESNYYLLKSEMYNITNGENDSLFEDFFHDCLEIFLNHPKAQEVTDKNAVKYFLVRIGLNNWRSKTSKFHYQYRREMVEMTDLIDIPANDYDITIDVMTELLMFGVDRMYNLDEKSRYRVMVIVIYHSLGSNFSEVERQYGIARTTVREIYNSGREQLQVIINDLINELNNGTLHLSNDITQVDSNWSNIFGGNNQQTVSVASKLFRSNYFNLS